tara:strand:- start:4736 stop:6208 length:1473 start_codon:yes stop_codon:yes gene_type:complete
MGDVYADGYFNCGVCKMSWNAEKLAAEIGVNVVPEPDRPVEPIYWLDTNKFVYLKNNLWYEARGDKTIVLKLQEQGNSLKAAKDAAQKLPTAVDYRFDPTTTEPVVKYRGLRYINTFRGLPLGPLEGQWPTIEMLLRHLVGYCDAGYEYVLDWLAAPIQSLYKLEGPKRNLSSLVFFGAQSTGKGMMFGPGGVMKRIYGEYLVEIGQRDLEDRFEIKEVIDGTCFFLSLNEVACSGARDVKILNKLKRYITEPTLSLRDMRKTSRQSGNIGFNLVFMSNDLEPIRIEPTDRRYSCFYQDTPLSKEQLSRLLPQVNKGWPEANSFLRFLLEREITHVLSKPCPSRARELLMEASRSSSQVFGDLLEEIGLRHVMRSWEADTRVCAPYFHDDGITEVVDGTIKSRGFVHMRILSSVYIHWCKVNGYKHPVKAQTLRRDLLFRFSHITEKNRRIEGLQGRGLEGINLGATIRRENTDKIERPKEPTQMEMKTV